VVPVNYGRSAKEFWVWILHSLKPTRRLFPSRFSYSCLDDCTIRSSKCCRHLAFGHFKYFSRRSGVKIRDEVQLNPIPILDRLGKFQIQFQFLILNLTPHWWFEKRSLSDIQLIGIIWFSSPIVEISEIQVRAYFIEPDICSNFECCPVRSASICIWQSLGFWFSLGSVPCYLEN